MSYSSMRWRFGRQRRRQASENRRASYGRDHPSRRRLHWPSERPWRPHEVRDHRGRGAAARVAWRHARPAENLARGVYLDQYYSRPSFDQIHAISPAVALELTDTGVNMMIATRNIPERTEELAWVLAALYGANQTGRLGQAFAEARQARRDGR